MSLFIVGCQSRDIVLTDPTTTPSNSLSSESPYVFGVFPYQSPERIEIVWAPIARDFAQELNREIRLRTRSSFENFLTSTQNEFYDIALMQPFDYVRVGATIGYEPLARIEEPLTGIFVVTQESSLESLEDLRGVNIALPPESAAVSVLAKITLQEAGIVPHFNHYVSHDSCLQQILIGLADVCVTNSIPLTTFEATSDIQFRVLEETLPIPHILFVVHRRVPDEDVAILRETILGWSLTDEGQVLLENTGMGQLVVATDGDYDIIRQYIAEIEENAN